MLSAQASCLEIRLSFLLFFFSFFLLLFFFLGPSFFFEERRKKGKKGVEEGRRWDESGVRQDLRRAV